MTFFWFVCDVCSTFWHQHPLSHKCYGTTERRIRVVQMVTEPKEEKDMTENKGKTLEEYKKKVLEVALRTKAREDWCDDEFYKAMVELELPYTPEDPADETDVVVYDNIYYIKWEIDKWIVVDPDVGVMLAILKSWQEVWDHIVSRNNRVTVSDLDVMKLGS